MLIRFTSLKDVLFSRTSLILLLMLGLSLTTLAQTENKLTASDGEALDYFGNSVSISGTEVVVGASSEDENGTSAGAAYVFSLIDDEWTEVIKLIASDGAAADKFGESVAIEGNRIIVGAPFDDDDAINSGSAYVFVRQGETWVEEDKITARDPAANSYFGSAVAIDGDYALVGALQDVDNDIQSGAAYVFHRIGTSWVQVIKLVSHDAADQDYFGCSVSLDGDYAVIGAKGDDDNGLQSGSAYLFVRSGNTWLEEEKITASNGIEEDNFGASVSISNLSVAVGARGSWRVVSAGWAYVFVRDDDGWIEQQAISPGDGEDQDNFGKTVAISGNYLAIGSWHDQDNGIDSGSLYAFTRSGETWGEFAKLTASDGEEGDLFGSVVAIDDDYVIVGAIGDDDWDEDSGAAYLIDLEIPTGMIEGMVTDAATGALVQGAEVRLTEDATGVFVGSTRTDAAGRFNFSSLYGGLYDLEVAHEEYFTFRLEDVFLEDDGLLTLDIAIEHLETRINGYVRNMENGNPIQNATVTLYVESSGEEIGIRTTNAEGFYRFAPLPPQSYNMHVEAEAYFPSDRNAVILQLNQDHYENFNLTPRRTNISGYIVNALNHDFIVGANLILRDAVNNLQLRTSVSSWGGSYSFLYLNPGRYIIEAVAEGYQQTVESNIELALYQELFLEIGLYPRNTRIFGAVTSVDTHEPVVNARVSLIDHFAELEVSSIRTDENGEYSFMYLDPGQYDISVIGVGYIPAARGNLVIATYDELPVNFELNSSLPVSIQAIQTLTGEGSWVTTSGIITIPTNVMSINRLDAYIQDESGYGIMLYNDRGHVDQETEGLFRGDEVRVTGRFTDAGFSGVSRLLSVEFELLSFGNELYEPWRGTTAAIAAARRLEGTYAEATGRLTSTPANRGTYSFNITDGSESVIILIYEDAHLNLSSYLVNDWIRIRGVISVNQSFIRIIPALQEDIIDIEAVGLYDSGEIPEMFTIAEVYPNPFNPTTQIIVGLSESAPLKVRVFNILGEEVALIADEFFNCGFHTFTFDARNMTSGIYFIHTTVPGKMNEMRKVFKMK